MPENIRINKFIADSGFCSRREADHLIKDGRVTIGCINATDKGKTADGSFSANKSNAAIGSSSSDLGKAAEKGSFAAANCHAADGWKTADLGSRVEAGQEVRVDGNPIFPDSDLVFIAMNKPIAVTCTTDANRDDNIVRLVGHPKRIFPVGRLDRDSEGLILLTNDGSIVNKILRAGNRHEKEYVVTVDHPVTPAFLSKMAAGVPILGTVTKPCRVIPVGPRTFRMILTQGLNRQIRRMCEVFGYEVTRLVRVRIMNIRLGDLQPGQWRNLTPGEVASLRRQTRDSSQQPDQRP